jgi:hypothetical protein
MVVKNDVSGRDNEESTVVYEEKERRLTGLVTGFLETAF